MLIPHNALHPGQQVLDGAVLAVAHHRVGGGGVAGAVHQRLPDGVVERPVIGGGEHVRVGALGEVLPAPLGGADGVGFRLGFCGVGRNAQTGDKDGAGDPGKQAVQTVFHYERPPVVYVGGLCCPNSTTKGSNSPTCEYLFSGYQTSTARTAQR